MIEMDYTFRRKISLNLSKQLKIPLGEMSFVNDFTDTSRGNLYPLITDEGTAESITDGVYTVNGSLRRLICQHCFYHEYYISILSLDGCAGISLMDKDGSFTDIYVEKISEGYSIHYSSPDAVTEKVRDIPNDIQGISFSFRSNAVDVYYRKNERMFLCEMTDIPSMKEVNRYPFEHKALLFVKGSFSTDKVDYYLDNGVALADMRPIRYEDGSVITENGRIFLTMSSRKGKGGCQSVISWLPGAADFRLEGVMLFDCGDGYISSDIASSVIYNRKTNEFYIWMCCFSHGHICGYGKTACDIKHGINIIDITPMPKASADDETLFAGFEGDEDPDFYFDEKNNRWLLTICRLRSNGNGRSYSYIRFESDNPFEGYRFLDATGNFGETGGSTVRIGEKRYFICGADMNAVSEYRIYDADNMKLIEKARFDYPDGGFRGWGTVIPLMCGNRKKLYWVTFDRVLGSTYNWSYGNLYVFETDE